MPELSNPKHKELKSTRITSRALLPFMVARIRRIPWVPILLVVVLITLLSFLIHTFVSPTNLVMFYLLGVMIVATRYGRTAATVTVLLSIVAFNFNFVPPRFTLTIENAQYLLTFLMMLIVGLVIAELAARMRENAESARRREMDTGALYALSRELSLALDLSSALPIIIHHIHQTFECEAGILLSKSGDLVLQGASPRFQMNSHEYQAARWVLEHQQTAGQGTDTLPTAEARYLPLKLGQDTVGVLGILPIEDEIPPEQDQLLEAFASQIAVRMDAFQLAEKARIAQLLQEKDRLHSALLNSISHDLKTPLVSIAGALSSLRDQAEYLDDTARQELIDGAWEESNRLNRLLVNLLDMTRLEADALPLKKIPCDLQEIIGVVIFQMKQTLAHRNVLVNIPADVPLVEADFVLMVQVLSNLLDNAAKYSPPESPIEITVESGEELRVYVADHGIGVPENATTKVFDKFYRAENTVGVGGTGLGLSICRGIIEAHGGRIWIENRPEGGIRVGFTLPLADMLGMVGG